jgi:hypothetical protein
MPWVLSSSLFDIEATTNIVIHGLERLLQISVHLQQMRKIGLSTSKMGRKIFWTQKNFFANKNTIKACESPTKSTQKMDAGIVH